MFLLLEEKIIKACALLALLFLSTLILPQNLFAANVKKTAIKTPPVEVYLSPSTDTPRQGSVFQVQILTDTKNKTINAIDLKINFDKDKLKIINSSASTSIIGIWTEPPKFDNTLGIASYMGVVPGGINTNSGLIGTITFQAMNAGNAEINFDEKSQILLNDGFGTRAETDFKGTSLDILFPVTEYAHKKPSYLIPILLLVLALVLFALFIYYRYKVL